MRRDARGLPLTLVLAGVASVVGLGLVGAGTTSGELASRAASAAPARSPSLLVPTTTTTQPGSSLGTSTVAVPGTSPVVEAARVAPTTTSTLLSTTTISPTIQGASRASADNCGGQEKITDNLGTWTCSFDDEFAGTSLDTSKWTVMTTAATGFMSDPYTCYEDSPNNVSVGNGYLTLTDRKESKPFWCGTATGGFLTQYTGGYVSSYDKFTTTYGRFEILAKVPAPTAPGVHSALWLYPESLGKGPTGYGTGPASGEIDLAEMYSKFPGLAVPTLHYNYDPATTNPSTGTNVVTNDHCSVNSSAFNDYVLEWTPTTISMTYNGTTCLVDHWVPKSPLVAPEPFNQPFFLNLTQNLQDYIGSENTAPLPASLEIKYVRVWSLSSAG